MRNVTDVGHLENDEDEGEDKTAKKARLINWNPWRWRNITTIVTAKPWSCLMCCRLSIEPHASGHIMEQIEFTQKILDAGYAYESNGSVYFDVENTTATIITVSFQEEI